MQPNVHALRPAPMPRTFGVVLSENLLARLSRLNAAARDLRQMGYSIAAQDLNANGMRPVIRIRPAADQSIVALLECGGVMQAPAKVLLNEVMVEIQSLEGINV